MSLMAGGFILSVERTLGLAQQHDFENFRRHRTAIIRLPEARAKFGGNFGGHFRR